MDDTSDDWTGPVSMTALQQATRQTAAGDLDLGVLYRTTVKAENYIISFLPWLASLTRADVLNGTVQDLARELTILLLNVAQNVKSWTDVKEWREARIDPIANGKAWIIDAAGAVMSKPSTIKGGQPTLVAMVGYELVQEETT